MDTNLRTFPDSYVEALTMLYLERQDLTDKTPEELVELYMKTYYRISDASSKAHKAAHKESRKQWFTESES